MAKSKTTLTLDDIEMIGEVVQATENRIQNSINLRFEESEERILQKVISKEEFVSLMEGVLTTIIEKKFKEVIGQFPKRAEFSAQMQSQAGTLKKVEEEHIVLTYQFQQHEKRITSLEKKWAKS